MPKPDKWWRRIHWDVFYPGKLCRQGTKTEQIFFSSYMCVFFFLSFFLLLVDNWKVYKYGQRGISLCGLEHSYLLTKKPSYTPSHMTLEDDLCLTAVPLLTVCATLGFISAPFLLKLWLTRSRKTSNLAWHWGFIHSYFQRTRCLVPLYWLSLQSDVTGLPLPCSRSESSCGNTSYIYILLVSRPPNCAWPRCT